MIRQIADLIKFSFSDIMKYRRGLLKYKALTEIERKVSFKKMLKGGLYE